MDLNRVAFFHIWENCGRKVLVSRKHEGKRVLEERFYSQIQEPSPAPPVCPSASFLSPHAVSFSEIHFLAVAIGSASVLMIIVVTAMIICRQRRRKARNRRLEAANTER